jgi:hypothetical protein
MEWLWDEEDVLSQIAIAIVVIVVGQVGLVGLL